MAEQLTVQIRETRGKKNARRLRQNGLVPAILYGHGEANVSLSVPADKIAAIVRHGSRVLTLQGDVQDQVLIRDLQWDPFGATVLHVDFARVSAEERVIVRLPVELRGEAPGVREGGMINHVVHETEIECRVTDVPDRVVINVNQLHVGGALTIADLELPPGARVLADADLIVVQCVEQVAVVEEEAPPSPAEPEVIGRVKPEAEESEE